MSKDKSLVHYGDLLAAVIASHGSGCSILDWSINLGTETVQGFASLMLRAKIKVKTALGEVTEVNLMVKRPPALEVHAAMINSMGNIIQREGAYFNIAVPKLQEKCPQLPIVRTLVAHENAIIMEDLCERGFQTLCKTMQDMGRGNKLTFPIARMCVRKLAKIHAASLGVNWDEVIPPLDMASSEIFKMLIGRGIQTIIPMMKKLFPEHRSLEKYAEFMAKPKLLDDFIEYMAYDESRPPNVLLHGDCHINNMMFKLDKKGNAVDMCFIDFQIFRYGPACNDLIYLMYTSANQAFRDKHEKDVVRAYVEAFNAAACITPDLLDFDQFWRIYERTRYFGVVMAMGIRPLQFITEFQPATDKGELTEEAFAAMNQFDGAMVQPAMLALENDPEFREEFRTLIAHAMDVLRDFVFQK
ncbi:uncharacterized protein LOC135934032 [Cloeon dipterum]|uniref:uncharacterized protein LOC135934032 n=1 Tax=Cloeon dipterum TaxID=197152 RepID=UPI00321FA411